MSSTSKSTGFFEWNIDSTKLLISLYEENEVLYNNLHPLYKDRNKRLEVLVNISNIVSDTTGNFCLVSDVRKKISNLRSQYLAERLKVIKTKSGSSGDGKYTPTAYWFPLLRFLDSSSTADQSESNLDTPNSTEILESEDSTDFNVPPNGKRNKKRRNEDEIIQEAASTIRDMAQLAKKKCTEGNSNINTFCKFMESELNCILETSKKISYINKAKREIQKIIFNIWDNIDEVSNEVATRKNYYSCEDSDQWN